VAYVVDAKDRDVVACFHDRVDADLLGTDVVFNLGRWYNNALVGVESNNHGLTTNKALARMSYSPLYHLRTQSKARAQPSETLGWRTTTITKPLAIDELNLALREGQLRCQRRGAQPLQEGTPRRHRLPPHAPGKVRSAFRW
jgi:hypothetical protein